MSDAPAMHEVLGARGDGVRYQGSIFLAGQGRLLSLFMAGSLEEVRAVNEAALIPFTAATGTPAKPSRPGVSGDGDLDDAVPQRRLGGCRSAESTST